MDRLTRLRAPLAVAALVALTLVAAARVGLGLSEVASVGGSTAVAAARLAPNASDGTLTVLAGALVASCFLPPQVGSRRGLAVWGVLLTGLSVVATVVALSLANLEVAGWSLVWLIPDLAVPALVGVGLLVLGLERAAGAPVPLPAAPAVDQDETEDEEAAPAPDPELEPSWPEDTAAGAVWRTAGEAARGAPAVGWGSEGATSWSAPALPTGAPEQDDGPRRS